uniref:Uncharacterized protein n=1 Tax=Aplanochytrium stocchinoi TaxID=215587 RepID=A0A7S3PBK7_9STRA
MGNIKVHDCLLTLCFLLLLLNEPKLRVIAAAQNGIYEFCAVSHGYNTKDDGFFIAQVNQENKVTQKWFPVNPFAVVYNEAAGNLSLVGEVYPEVYKEFENNFMSVELEFSKPKQYTGCYCASPEFQKKRGTWTDPSYSHIEKKCTKDKYMAYLGEPNADTGLSHCPKCEGGLCKEAKANRQKNDARTPIYEEWDFFQTVTGKLGGPGLRIFRKELFDTWYGDEPIEPEYEECNLDISTQPLPQAYCSNYSSPDDGYGYGVNGKNQECGMGTWFTCTEDQNYLNEEYVGKFHIGDINIRFIKCPPTNAPTPQPTAADIPCVDIPCCKYVNITVDEQVCKDTGGDWCPVYQYNVSLPELPLP